MKKNVVNNKIQCILIIAYTVYRHSKAVDDVLVIGLLHFVGYVYFLRIDIDVIICYYFNDKIIHMACCFT